MKWNNVAVILSTLKQRESIYPYLMCEKNVSTASYGRRSGRRLAASIQMQLPKYFICANWSYRPSSPPLQSKKPDKIRRDQVGYGWRREKPLLLFTYIYFSPFFASLLAGLVLVSKIFIDVLGRRCNRSWPVN